MGWDPSEWTNASLAADQGMSVAEGLMSFASDRRGKPSNEQRSLYLGAVAFTYAVWESYVEEVAIELAQVAAEELHDDPARVPESARSVITEGATPWELAVSPGWRGLWVQRVEALTRGENRPGAWGLNTANVTNVRTVFAAIGIDPVPDKVPAPKRVRALRPQPANVSVNRSGQVDVPHALNTLISVRGEAVHTARTNDPLFKNEVLWWGEFVHELYEETDQRARAQLATLLGL